MKIGFIGAGHMAQAIIAGLLLHKTVAPTNLVLHGGTAAHYEPYATSIGATAVATNAAVAQAADVLILAVEPALVDPVLTECHDVLAARRIPVVSMLTGVSLAQLAAALGIADYPVLRIMPNVNVAVAAGMTAYAPAHLADAQLQAIVGLFEAIGETIALPEKDFATFVALAGSSPAFVFMFIDAMARAGVKYGLTKAQATKIAAQAVAGSGQLVLRSTASPADLADQVASPGGTTIAGLLAMESAGFMPAVWAGIDATIAKDRQTAQTHE